jgi:hypothetical protein
VATFPPRPEGRGFQVDIKGVLADEITKNHEYILSHWDNGENGEHPGWGLFFKNFPNGEFQQWHIACKPHHPFIERTIKTVLFNINNYSPEKYGVGLIGTLKTTGPIAYTLSILSVIKQVNNFTLYRTNQEAGFVYQNTKKHHIDILYDEKIKHYRKIDTPVILS